MATRVRTERRTARSARIRSREPRPRVLGASLRRVHGRRRARPPARPGASHRAGARRTRRRRPAWKPPRGRRSRSVDLAERRDHPRLRRARRCRRGDARSGVDRRRDASMVRPGRRPRGRRDENAASPGDSTTSTRRPREHFNGHRKGRPLLGGSRSAPMAARHPVECEANTHAAAAVRTRAASARCGRGAASAGLAITASVRGGGSARGAGGAIGAPTSDRAGLTDGGEFGRPPVSPSG